MQFDLKLPIRNTTCKLYIGGTAQFKYTTKPKISDINNYRSGYNVTSPLADVGSVSVTLIRQVGCSVTPVQTPRGGGLLLHAVAAVEATLACQCLQTNSTV